MITESARAGAVGCTNIRGSAGQDDGLLIARSVSRGGGLDGYIRQRRLEQGICVLLEAGATNTLAAALKLAVLGNLKIHGGLQRLGQVLHVVNSSDDIYLCFFCRFPLLSRVYSLASDVFSTLWRTETDTRQRRSEESKTQSSQKSLQIPIPRSARTGFTIHLRWQYRPPWKKGLLMPGLSLKQLY
ncbi:uncharacterized protein BDR25DRAFT_351311 [Lindgomyces ingoldianus]|uniref:Uncharacterized protein n=1 Tax=Lindgomyces ingoldianus TaxID=673940 RepID=A0ACB6R6L8_9PLEO|nr:uncharacterized protein BDR25DRAFT_351311 [Lindgomyces ingoldianus]KAF2474806.1 hypothetical protein BDR25DRAFT_351311 [Lindgomyces ingoldianus]